MLPPGLAKVSMFPFTIFWRIDKEMELKNPCGGLATIIALGILIVVSILKFIQVFKMTTIIATSTSTMNLEPPMTNVSTIQNNPIIYPYMFGLGFYQDLFYVSSNVATANYVVMTGPLSSRTTTSTPIPLQNCTSNHFSVIPNITDKQNQWGISKWMCLPLNQTYEIGGSYQLSTLYKSIQINVSCTNSSNHQDCGYVNIYTLNTFVDPTSLNPATYFISQDTFLVKAQASYEYSSTLTENILVIDTSLLPTPSYTNITSTQSNPIVLQQSTSLSVSKQTIVKIEASGKLTTFNRSYLKLLDALSFIGGIFQTILAVFFFMAGYNRFHFEMRFANEYFKTKETKDNTFKFWFRHSIQGVLKGTKYEPEWSPLVDKRNQIKQTVNKVLDVIYLNKRIAFLEVAISLLFEKHQLKGLYLMHSLTRDQAEESFQRHKLRDRLILFLNKNQKINDKNVEKQFGQIFGQNGQNNGKKSSDEDGQITKKRLEEQGYVESNNIKSSEIDDISKPGKISLRGVFGEHFPKQDEKSSEGIINQAEDEYKDFIEGGSPEMLKQRKQRRKILEEEVEYIGQMEEQQLKEGELVEELQTDLKLLMDEAENEDCRDERSRRIYQQLDEWLKEELRIAIHEQVTYKKYDYAKPKKNAIRKKNEKDD